MDAIAIETLLQEVREGRVGVERLVDLIAAQQRLLQAAQQQLEAAKQRIDELEKKHGVPPSPKLAQPFSMRAEEQRQRARGEKPKAKRKGRRGRFKTIDKVALAERSEAVFPEGVPRQQCRLSHIRPVWRLEHGQSVLIAYQIYRGPNSQ
jgi:hypothetical protein